MKNSQQNKSDGGAIDGSSTSIFRVPPHHYLHVQDQTTYITRVEKGPVTFVRKDNEKVFGGPCKMVIIPPQHYCVVTNPVCKDENGLVINDPSGQAKLLHADTEIRLSQDPFPLYPGEEAGQIKLLQVVTDTRALKLRALRDFSDGGVKRAAGDEFLFEGPGTYIPRKEVEVLGTVQAEIVYVNEALKIKAAKETCDRNNIARVAGEEYLIRKTGSYLPGPYEIVLERVKALFLTATTALHVRAKKHFVDQFGKSRKSGEEYLITLEDTDSFIPEVYEEVVGDVPITTLSVKQYCVILNPMGEDGKLALGQRKMVKGEKSFFLHPGEELEDGIEEMYILGENEGIVLKALEDFEDETTPHPMKPGDTWMRRGPLEYTPPVQVKVLSIRASIPLHDNEGIYVRNIRTGGVRAVIGQSYMLKEDEELWAKKLPDIVKALMDKNRDVQADRSQWINPRKNAEVLALTDETRVVTFQVPNNAAVQIYDYKSKVSRVVFGPDLVMLQPNEEFTQQSLSGGKPKKPNKIRCLALLLGPDFCTDIVTIETSDHARLELQLSYNWHFDIADKKDDPKEAAKLFCTVDFIGDMCHTIASRIRGAVSSVSFDDFHKNSSRIITVAVFGVADGRTPKSEFRNPFNNLVVTSIDIRSVEPVDQRTRDSLQKSVTLAIEITTQSQEAAAKREAEIVDQEARGRLERQKIADEAEAEKARKMLLTLQAESAAIEATGQAKAEASSRSESALIETQAKVEVAALKVQAVQIESDGELERLAKARAAEIKYLMDQNELELEKARHMSELEVHKFKAMTEALGTQAIAAIASAPQDHQVKMLQSLGLSSTLITDGRTPINLLNTASGLLGALGSTTQGTGS